MQDVFALHDGGYGQNAIYVEDFASPALWQLLGTAPRAGIVLRGATKSSSVNIHAPVNVGLDLVDANGKLRVVPTVQETRGATGGGAGAVVAAGAAGTELQMGVIGEPAHGLWWQDPLVGPARESLLHLAPTVGGVPGVVAKLLAAGQPLEIPKNGRAAFVRDYVPELGRRTTVSSSDGAVEVAHQTAPRLHLTAKHFQRAAGRNRPQVNGLHLTWEWDYSAGARERLPLVDGGPIHRDRSAERAMLRNVAEQLEDFPDAWQQAFPQPLVARPGSNEPLELEAVAAARFAAEALPRLEALDDVIVEIQGEEVEYVELTQTPEISVSANESDSSDWFDLGVQVHLGGAEVPFDQLFVAQAQAEKYLLLEDGSYFALDKPEYQQLRRLIEEAKGLQDRDAPALKISRHQASLWDELVELSANAEQAESWK